MNATENKSITYDPIGCRYDVTLDNVTRTAYVAIVDDADCLRLGQWDDAALPHAEALAARFRGRVHRYRPDHSSLNPIPGIMLVVLPDQPPLSTDPIEDEDD